jgi:hypothetical protein
VSDTSPTEPTPSSPTDPDPRQRVQYPRWIWALGFGVVVIVALAIAGLTLSGSDDDVSPGGAIEQLIPARDSQILQQEAVGVQLGAGYDASLAINGTAIPDLQLDKTPGLNLVLFQPGPDKAFEQLPPGQNCVVVTSWRVETGRDDSSRFSWCFTVL